MCALLFHQFISSHWLTLTQKDFMTGKAGFLKFCIEYKPKRITTLAAMYFIQHVGFIFNWLGFFQFKCLRMPLYPLKKTFPKQWLFDRNSLLSFFLWNLFLWNLDYFHTWYSQHVLIPRTVFIRKIFRKLKKRLSSDLTLKWLT